MSLLDLPRSKGLEIYTIVYKMRIIMSTFRKIQQSERQLRPVRPQDHAGEGPHAADLYVGRQIAAVRVQSDVTQSELARAVRISPHQLQKYENATNRVSASMLFEIAAFLGVPVSRFFDGLPGNERQEGEVAALLPVDERITFIASSEGRRLIKALMRLQPRMRRRVSSLIAALGEELSALEEEGCQPPKTDNGTTRTFHTGFASDDDNDDDDRGQA